jgi:hypothetical protein
MGDRLVRLQPLVRLLPVVAVVLAGCGLVPGARIAPGFQGGASCGMMPGGVCQEQIDRAAARHPDATQVDVACTAPVCDRRSGAGTVVVTLANGAKVTEAFTYAGDPAPIPAPTCTGLAIDICRSVAASTVDGIAPSKSIRAISVTCAASSCTRDKGDADVRVRFGDGSESQFNSGWDGGPP